MRGSPLLVGPWKGQRKGVRQGLVGCIAVFGIRRPTVKILDNAVRSRHRGRTHSYKE